MESAWKVGVFVVAFAILLVLAFALVGNPLFKKPTAKYYAEFSDAANIQPGAVVTMAGVEIGSVDSVALKGPRMAEIVLLIDPKIALPLDTVATVPTSLLSIGEQRIELVSKTGQGRLSAGARIPGEKASFLTSYLPEGNRTIELLNQNLEATQKLLGDRGIRQRIDAILASSDKTIQQLGTLLGDARVVLNANQAPLRRLLENASTAVAELRTGIQAVNKIAADPKMAEQARQIMSSLSATADKAEKLVASLNQTISGFDLKTTMANVEKITSTGVDIANNAKTMSEDGKVITSKVVELADQAKQIAGEAKALVDKLNKYVDSLGPHIKVPRLSTSLETSRNLETNRFQTDVTASYPLDGGRFLYGGIYDVTESNKIIAQLGQPIGKGSLRYGIFASKAGVGVDYPLSPSLVFGGDLFDPNNIKLNLRATIKFGADWYGFVGIDKLFKEAEPRVGFGIRR